MRGNEERQALEDIKWLRQTIDKLSDRIIINALARDAEGVTPTDGVFEQAQDTVHDNVRKMCSDLHIAADSLDRIVGVLSVLTQGEPTGERVQAVPDCLACGELAIPRPKSGFCENCYRKWLRFRSAGLGDRDAFIGIQKQNIGGDTGHSDLAGDSIEKDEKR